MLIDYAHNPDGLGRLLAVARSLNPARFSLLLGQAGNRDDQAIAELARTAARFTPDRIAIKELALMLRGRAPGEVPALLVGRLCWGGYPRRPYGTARRRGDCGTELAGGRPTGRRGRPADPYPRRS